VQQAIVPKNGLPTISPDGKYFLRYRVVSEDATSRSNWSNIYSVTGNSVADLIETTTSIQLSIVADNLGMNIAWSMPDRIKDEVFDVFVSWAYSKDYANLPVYGDWVYAQTVKSNASYVDTSNTPSHALYMKARIQISSTQNSISDTLLLVESEADNDGLIGVATQPQIVGGSVYDIYGSFTP
jgi:hypothetical protein